MFDLTILEGREGHSEGSAGHRKRRKSERQGTTKYQRGRSVPIDPIGPPELRKKETVKPAQI